MLDRQINLFKVDTNAFLTEEELYERKYLVKLRKVRDMVANKLPAVSTDYKILKTKPTEELTKYELALLSLDEKIDKEKERWKEFLLQHAKENIEYNKTHTDKRIRNLDEKYLYYTDSKDGLKRVNLSNVVAMFESTLSRSFGIKTNELTYDIFILEIFYYDIAQDLILNGFNYNGKHYVYFSSSAGQIRTKKAVFVEEEKYESCKLKLMCGLTIDKINEKGGMNVNKFLAYLALVNSATDLWEDVFGQEFDIDKSIVVDDFETMVKCKVDNIDYITYEITPDVVQNMPIPHTDGCGMISKDYSEKNFMVRLPFIKGLLGSFDFKRFIIENNCSPIIKDIWGKEYDIFKDDIQVIFTKSQLKMWKYYADWDEYKEYFKKYKCEACICNMEEDRIPNAKINYQMLQTLYDATDDEIKELCKVSNDKIQKISDSLENALYFFGVSLDQDDSKKDYFQKALKLYPELLNDPANKADLRDLKNSLIKKYRGAKLDVSGKFTFVLPDLYAFCERLFCGIKTPKGLIEDGEVFCQLYKNSDKLDCLRSPHLYIEHAIRKNVYKKKYRHQILNTWFTTDAIYISTHDLISRILQLDVDGDRLLVISQPLIIKMAERVMEGVNPLYYEMKKANAQEINYQNIYDGLILAFTGGKIGGISNDITKIWSNGKIDEDAKNAVRWLCMEVNFTIDYAKTLFKPTRPEYVDEILKKYGRQKVPHFFYYAKDKRLDQVEEINDCTINKIVKEIKDSKNMFRPMKNLAHIDYILLLKNKTDSYSNNEVNKVFDKWNKKYGNNISFDEENSNRNNIIAIAKQVKTDLNNIEPDDDKVVNSLVSFLYKKPSTRKKKLLWYVYGTKLYDNLANNVDNNNVCRKCGKRTEETLINGKCSDCRKEESQNQHGMKTVKCVDCGEEFNVSVKNIKTIRCPDCSYQRSLERKRRYKASFSKSGKK